MGTFDFRQLRSLGLVLAAAGVCATAALASPGAAPSRIVFAANRVALSFGEVYRVNADGSRVDLSNSPAPDLAPAVSPDGKQVAFVSSRGGHLALYVVGINGDALRRLSPSLFATAPNDGVSAQIVWSPDGRQLAADVGGSPPHGPGLYVADLRGGWRTIARNIYPGQSRPAWSPDGRFLAYTTSVGGIQVVSGRGKRLWSVAGEGGSAWSLKDRLAVSANSFTVDVYDPNGHRLATFPAQSFAWAPTNNLLAVMNGKRLQLRPGGTGKPTLNVRIAKATPGNATTGIAWVGTGRLRMYGGDGWVGYDLAHKRAWALPAVATVFSSIVSPDGTVAVQQNEGATDETLMLLPPGARSAQVLQTAPTCGDELPFASLQFVSHTGALIYQSGCQEPSADIYAVNPDGGGLAPLTNTPTDETQPSLSPDGSSVVYVQQQFAESCKGCPQTLWRVSANGGTPQQLTTHTFQDNADFDDSPSWSPDGTKIAFRRSGAAVPYKLFTIPAGGGTAKSVSLQGIGVPFWGPQQIAFADGAVPRPVIKTYDPASGAVHIILSDTSAGAGKKSLGPLAWSADSRLAYIEYDADGRASISVIGSKPPPINLAPLLPRASRVSGLAWSPAGTDFAFVATDANGVGEVYTIGTDGKSLKRVTDSIGALGGLSWR